MEITMICPDSSTCDEDCGHKDIHLYDDDTCDSSSHCPSCMVNTVGIYEKVIIPIAKCVLKKEVMNLYNNIPLVLTFAGCNIELIKQKNISYSIGCHGYVPPDIDSIITLLIRLPIEKENHHKIVFCKYKGEALNKEWNLFSKQGLNHGIK